MPLVSGKMISKQSAGSPRRPRYRQTLPPQKKQTIALNSKFRLVLFRQVFTRLAIAIKLRLQSRASACPQRIREQGYAGYWEQRESDLSSFNPLFCNHAQKIARHAIDICQRQKPQRKSQESPTPKLKAHSIAPGSPRKQNPPQDAHRDHNLVEGQLRLQISFCSVSPGLFRSGNRNKDPFAGPA